MDFWPVRVLRGFSGFVAGGVVALTLVVVGAAVLGGERDFPGPGTQSVTWHLVASVLVVGVQWWADRRRGVLAVGASVLVIAAAIGLLWTQWWD